MAEGTEQDTSTSPLSVAVIGCGLIGRRRAEVAQRSPDGRLIIVADVDAARAEQTAQEFGCDATADWPQAVSRDDVDVVIVSTTNNWLAPIALAALDAGKHVLVEKPMARDASEAEAVVTAAASRKRVLGVGFNHRHHQAMLRAYELFAQGAIGDVTFLRCRYGHGGRPGYGQEWRADPAIAGGGELLDQGVHAVDLFRWFAGEFADAFGMIASYLWTVGGQVEDNGFATFRTASGQIATLHASWTQWKNLFSFEIFGTDGYLVVEGLGGSYGPERLTWGRRRPESGPPIEEQYEFPLGDTSWQLEWEELVAAIREGREPLGSGYGGWQALRMLGAVYESHRTGQLVKLS